MRLALLLILPFSFAVSTQAAQYQAFCWAEVASGVQCTPIKSSLSYPIQAFACRQYALALGSTKSGFFRDTDSSRLRQKLEETCNYVDHQPKWGCFLEVRCETPGGVTSSIAPLGKTVFSPAGDPDAARKACVTESGSFYLEALKTAGSDCLLGARAVMMVP